ncbi:MAG: hypothetical protein AAF363_16985 [Bacteroidota bacterium]
MMKAILFSVFLMLFTHAIQGQSIIEIPPKQTIQIDYPNYDVWQATLKNKSLKGIDVAVMLKQDGYQVRGFGLGTKGNVDVMVEQESILVLKNDTKSVIKIELSITEKDRSVFRQEGNYISFTLENTSSKSIPLLIPNVMNPNLSPKSKSGVDLEIGQEILFRSKGKTHVLLVVDESIQSGDAIDVPLVLKKRKEELGL